MTSGAGASTLTNSSVCARADSAAATRSTGSRSTCGSNASSAPQSSTGRRRARGGPSWGRANRPPRTRGKLSSMPQSSATRRRGASRVSWSYRTRCSRVVCSGIGSGVLVRPLTGLADGLAPDCSATRSDSPHLHGSPAPRTLQGLSGVPRRIVTRRKYPASAHTYVIPHGRNFLCGELLGRRGGLADGLRHERGDVIRVLPLDQIGRHLAVALGAPVVDRVEHQVLGRPQVVEVGPDLGDRAGGLERVAVAAAFTEQLTPVLLGLGEVGDIGGGDVVAVLDGGDHR